jgi:periplasmic protein CpxP/Spy
MRSEQAIHATRTRSQTRRRTLSGVLLLPAVLVLASALPLAAPAASDGSDAAPSAPVRPAPHPRRGASIDDRVRTLTKALDLDERQQTELKAVLQAQREETLKVWADETVPPAVRVKATEAVAERTADRIRALLSDEQKKKYNLPRQVPDHSADRPDVGRWMKPA